MREIKDSGIEWIGEIPKDWEIIRIGVFSKVTSSKRIFEQDYVYEGVPFYRSKEITDLSKGIDVQTEIYISDETFNVVNQLSPAPKYGDILLTSIGTVGNVWVSDGRKFYYKDGNITQIECNDSFNSNYLKYCFLSNVILEQYSRLAIGSTLLALTIKKIKKMIITFPPRSEQNRIAEYLDKKCNKIDEIISKQQTIIEKLKEYKLSIITEAVIKGLNPDVTMKDSGVEWIGEIPEHWKITKIKHKAILNPKCDFSHISYDTLITYTPMECVKNGYYNNRTEILSKIPSSLTPFEEGDIVMAKVTPCFENGNIAIMNNLQSKVGLGSSELFVFRSKGILTKYLFYFLQNINFTRQACLTMTGAGGLKRVSSEFCKNCKLPLPPYIEQKQIADYLDSKCEKIDFTINKKQKLIDKLTEYKKSLIYEVVTGKKEV